MSNTTPGAEAPQESTADTEAVLENVSDAQAAGMSEAPASDVVETVVPGPVSAEAVKRETYVPAATIAEAGVAAGAATLVPESQTFTPEPYSLSGVQAPQPVYVQAPTPPKDKGNRGAGILIALVAVVAYALIYSGVTYLIGVYYGTLRGVADVTTTNESFAQFLTLPVFYVPVVFFFLALTVLVAIVNRGGWWAYVLGAFAVAIVVYLSYIGGSLLTVQAWNMTPSEAAGFVSQRWLDPLAIAAAVIAREVPVWFGAWIASQGRKVTAGNLAAMKEYDRILAGGPSLSRQ
ncbi:hypothetical protein [Luethyella okanaganae]|uniref:ABC transporter n=1 Tax=Luethyella okanaganae TaxID=69372 RepID=A0ABW1VG13_9MICO